jgi:hypothetical protein
LQPSSAVLFSWLSFDAITLRGHYPLLPSIRHLRPWIWMCDDSYIGDNSYPHS